MPVSKQDQCHKDKSLIISSFGGLYSLFGVIFAAVGFSSLVLAIDFDFLVAESNDNLPDEIAILDKFNLRSI